MTRRPLLILAAVFLSVLVVASHWLWQVPSPIKADERCGPGYVCWPDNGGIRAVFAGCTYQGDYPFGYCKGTGATERYCSCEGSPDCTCTVPGGATCVAGGEALTNCACPDDNYPCTLPSGETCIGSEGEQLIKCTCYSELEEIDGDWCGDGWDSHGKNCYNAYGPYDDRGKCGCIEKTTPTDCILTGAQTIGCCYGESVTPTPIVMPHGGDGGGDGEPTPTPYFSGNIYEDANAVPQGIGGTDNLCTGDVSTYVSDSGGTVSISRTGENRAQILAGATYNIAANTDNDDYTVTLDLPFPPADPDNPWQCACNADPTDPYRCIYTNQQPDTTLVNFFIKRAGSTSNAWFQTLGGSSWADRNIESKIPADTCTPPTCTPALIAADAVGTTDSAGFPLSNGGVIITSDSGETYIHQTASRDSAIQAKALGVSVPIENYDYFFDKFGKQAQTLSSSAKPAVGDSLAVFQYTGDLAINENDGWQLTNTEQIIVFVDGNLIIDDSAAGENRITTVAEGGQGFLMFIVNGDLTITANVGYSDIQTNAAQADVANVEGVFVSDSVLTIAGQDGVTDRKFIGAGTFVGWGGVDLQRNFDNGDSPELNNNASTEVFIFRPDFIVNAPKVTKSAQMTWRELAPSF